MSNEQKRERRTRYWAIRGARAYPGVTFTAQFDPGRSFSYRYEDGLMHTTGIWKHLTYSPKIKKGKHG